MRAALHQLLSDLVQDLLDEAGAQVPVPDFSLEAPRSGEHGDFACNAAMLLAKSLRQPPRAIA
jgi:arginyl-tRNA synthetase